MHLIDLIIFVLAACTMIGVLFFKHKSIYGITAYSLGFREFSSVALFFTILATKVSGSGFFIDLEKFYSSGWLYLYPALGMILSMVLVICFAIPRSDKIIGHVSVANYMKNHYGEAIRMITAITGSVGVCGYIVIQYKIIEYITPSLFGDNVEPIYVVGTLMLIMAVYAYIGGIRHIIYTDIIQSVCFIVAFIFLLGSLFPAAEVIENVEKTTSLDKFGPISIFNDGFWENIVVMSPLFIYYAVPALNPGQFQRIAIGGSKAQLTKAWTLSLFGFCFVILVSCAISYSVFIDKQGLENKQIIEHLINSINTPGIKAIFFIGVISMCMSTADSYLNISAVMLTNDLFLRNYDDELLKLRVAKLLTLFISAFSFYALRSETDLLKVAMLTQSFYMPLITIPLWLAILNFKISKQCVWFSMGSTSIYILYSNFIIKPDYSPISTGLLLNGFTILFYHYIIEKWVKAVGVNNRLKDKR